MRHKFVIADDDGVIRSLFRNAFSDSYSLFTAADGEIALDIIKAEKPGLVFLDVEMPGLSGLEVLRRMKVLKLKAVVWMITGNEELEIITEALKLGAAGYLTKPFELGKIRGILRSVLVGEPKKSSARSWTVKKGKSPKPGKPGRNSGKNKP